MEERIREGLAAEAEAYRHRDRALLGTPRLSSATRRRVRRRQLGTLVLSAVVAAGLVAGSLQAVHLARGSAPQRPASGPVSGTQDAPPGWPVISFGGTRPTLEYQPGERAELTGPKQLVSYGSYASAGGQRGTWYVDVYSRKRGLYPNDDVVYRNESCEEIFVSSQTGGGGGGGCGGIPPGSGGAHPRWLAIGSGCCDGGLAEYDGGIASDVARVVVQPNGAPAFALTILRGPSGYGSYVFFLAPKSATGEVVAYGANGAVLEREPFCAPSWSSLPNVGRAVKRTGHLPIPAVPAPDCA